jgi:dTDP-4-dehydrorhamnose reductase
MSLEVWGGLECTVNRVGDSYFDQVKRTGHHDRPEDLDLIGGLGIRTVRYPVLWERTECGGEFDWTWTDERLERMRELGVTPIAGLVHHGSGPLHTSLIDPEFPEKLSNYARAVAERYPWIENYTPVNEPLTTARFSALYGHWYPHGKSDRLFACALLQQCRAIVLAMRAIREVNPEARLIQTEDLGKTFSTPKLAYQAHYDNERRWLTFDLLCGLVGPNHSMWNYFLDSEIEESELYWFVENSCAPDILGVNHYLTSDRYLDERIEIYPPHTHGRNRRHRYADVEAVRVAVDTDSGPAARLAEIWRRYRLPVAVTEAHIGCSADEQVRWFLQVWNAAEELRGTGADVRAVTAWALLGSFDWNCLLVRDDNMYESGVFDIRQGIPKSTVLAEVLKELATGKQPSDAWASEPGWWQKPERVLYEPEQFMPAEFLEQAGGSSAYSPA